MLAALALAWSLAAMAQSNPPSSDKGDQQPAAQNTGTGQQSSTTADQQTPPADQQTAPAGQQTTDKAKPGTEPVSGDAPSPPKDKDKAQPGTQPVSGDVPASATDKGKDKNGKPGSQPVNGDSTVVVDPDKVVEVGSQPVKVKTGSIEDVNAVGNRDIGGRGVGNWYSTDTEIKMGKTYADQIEKSTRMITDPVVVEYVNRIGQNIVKNSDCKVPFTIKIIDSDEINAMALPGGFFYVNSGLILNADEEAELAGVMAHETAHVCAHHVAREMTRANYTQIGMIPVMIMVGGWTGYGIYEGSQLAIPITFLKFSRDFEAQADYLGVQYMYRAGYDPQAFIAFFEKVQALEKRKPGIVSKAFSDHPQTPERILHSQEEIARILPARDEYTVSTSEFDDVKARLARIENKRRLTDTKGATRPSLRRAGTGSGNDSSGSGNGGNNNGNGNSNSGSGTDNSGDDRPTLHRRDDQN
jgi:hypothetical protein